MKRSIAPWVFITISIVVGILIIRSLSNEVRVSLERDEKMLDSNASLETTANSLRISIANMQQEVNLIKQAKIQKSNRQLGENSAPNYPTIPFHKPSTGLDNQSTFNSGKSLSSQQEEDTFKFPSMPQELTDIKTAMTEEELAELETEVDRRFEQINAKAANDQGISASELENLMSRIDPRAIALMRFNCEQFVLHDKLLKLNEEVFKEINPEP